MNTTTAKTTAKHKKKPTQAQVRIRQATEYLKKQGIDINSRSDDHYREAIIIASGIKTKEK